MPGLNCILKFTSDILCACNVSSIKNVADLVKPMGSAMNIPHQNLKKGLHSVFDVKVLVRCLIHFSFVDNFFSIKSRHDIFGCYLLAQLIEVTTDGT